MGYEMVTLSRRVLAIKLKIMIQSENISELSSNYAFSISINGPQRTLSKLIRYQTFSVSLTLRVSRQVLVFQMLRVLRVSPNSFFATRLYVVSCYRHKVRPNRTCINNNITETKNTFPILFSFYVHM